MADEKKAQEMYMEFQMLDQNIRQLQRQLEIVTQQLMEATATNRSIEELDSIKAGREIFVPVSTGIFARATINDKSKLLVNVGANVVVEKDSASAKRLIAKQIDEIKKVRDHMVNELEKLATRASQLETQLQSMMQG